MKHSTFGHVLRRFRGAAGLTQEQLAEKAAISAQEVSNLERGERQVPQSHTLYRLVAALELAPSDRRLLENAARHPGGRRTQRAATLPPPAHLSFSRAEGSAGLTGHAVVHLVTEMAALQSTLVDLVMANHPDQENLIESGQRAIS